MSITKLTKNTETKWKSQCGEKKEGRGLFWNYQVDKHALNTHASLFLASFEKRMPSALKKIPAN